MSTAGRAALQQIFSSPPYKDWAKVPGNKTDATKVALEFEGVRRPTAGSLYAKGLQNLCRLNPPDGTPVPPPPLPPSTLSAVWKLDAAFTNGGLSNFAGAPRQHAWDLGWRAVYVQLMHINQDQVDANVAEMNRTQWSQWTKVGWSTYGQGSDPKQDGLAAAALCKQLNLAGWKANGEAWAEQQYAWKTSAFV